MLLFLIDKVFLCWWLDNIDVDRFNLNGAWVMLDKDLADNNCWGLVQYNWGGLDNQWGMVYQDFGGWAFDNDGGRAMDENFTLVMGICDG